jgi:hypothetical protein
MSKCRHALADALARLLFDKPLSELDRAEAMKLYQVSESVTRGWIPEGLRI